MLTNKQFATVDETMNSTRKNNSENINTPLNKQGNEQVQDLHFQQENDSNEPVYEQDNKPLSSENKPVTDRFGPLFKPALHPEMLPRANAAAALGISSSEFRRREAAGIYTPTYISQSGWRFYSIQYLSTLPGYGERPKRTRGRMTGSAKEKQLRRAIQRKKKPAPSLAASTDIIFPSNFSYEPHIAANVFDALDNNLDAGEIVKKFLVHPDIVAKIYEAWVRMKTMKGGGIQISAATLEIINNLPLPGTYPITNDAQLLENLREACKDVPTCNACKNKPCRLCLTCAKDLYAMSEEALPQPRLPAKRPVGRPRKSA